jgi:hypothetical protein
VAKVIKKQPFRKYKGSSRELITQIDKLQEIVQTIARKNAVMKQTPSALWVHRNELVEDQEWVNYRIAVRQLNFHHEG